MEFYAIGLGLVLVVILLLLLLVHLTGRARRQETRRRLGMPINARLTSEQANALRTFEDTDMKLKKSFPNISDRQRQVIARDVLHDKGLLPKSRKPASLI